MRIYKPYFYTAIFQISIKSDQNWPRYAFLNFENCRFWGFVTSRDRKLEIDNANLQFIFLCTYISNFNTFRPKMAEICIFEF